MWVRAAECDVGGIKVIPDAGILITVRKIHCGEGRYAPQKGKWRHVHYGEAGKLGIGNLDQYLTHLRGSVLRLLHRESYHVIAREIGVCRCHRIKVSRELSGTN